MSRLYRSKQEYINTLGEVLEAREDFKGLEYHKHPNTGEEYLFLSAITGEVFMLDVTGYTEEKMFHCIAMIECQGLGSVDNLIKDTSKRLEIGKLFS